MKSFVILLLILLAPLTIPQSKKIQVIFDSDMGPDYDDAGAIAVLHTLADSGYVKILAVCASSKYEGVAGVFCVFNTYFGRPEIPIGVPKGNASTEKDWQHWTDTILLKYPHKLIKNDEAEDAVELYRKTLAGQPDNSVTIITVGFLTNLSNLLETKGDKYSPLNGIELVRKKVKKLVSMAGCFPKGREFNIYSDSIASKKVFEQWPSEILFAGFETGAKIKTGLPFIKNTNINNSPVKDVFSICIPKAKSDAGGRMSWDEITVLAAVKGAKPWFSSVSGRIIVFDDGSNNWDYTGVKHSYLKIEKSYPDIEDVLNRLMTR